MRWATSFWNISVSDCQTGGQTGAVIQFTSSSVPVSVFCLAVSIDEIQNAFSIYPNPVNDYIRIENSKNVKIDRICVIDYMGKTIAEEQNEFDGFTCSNLKSGIYYMLIYTGGKMHSHKFLKN